MADVKKPLFNNEPMWSLYYEDKDITKMIEALGLEDDAFRDELREVCHSGIGHNVSLSHFFFRKYLFYSTLPYSIGGELFYFSKFSKRVRQ